MKNLAHHRIPPKPRLAEPVLLETYLAFLQCISFSKHITRYLTSSLTHGSSGSSIIMSIQLKIELPLRAIVELKKSSPWGDFNEDAASLQSFKGSEDLVDEIMFAVTKALDDLPYNITSTDEASTISFDDAESVATATAPFSTANVDEPVDEQKPAEADKTSCKEDEEPVNEGRKTIEVTVRSSFHHSDEVFRMQKDDTMAELCYAFAYRAAWPTDRFVFEHEGTTYRGDDKEVSLEQVRHR